MKNSAPLSIFSFEIWNLKFEISRFDWVPRFDPGFKSALERAHRRESFFDQHARHTGGGGLVGSRAIDDNLAAGFDVFETVDSDRCRNSTGISIASALAASVDDDRLLAAIEHVLQIADRN